jgi:hypothetical protein
MSSITVDIRLRPVRFAFLVRPEDARRTLEIFRICTCLWGGKYNPIVPYFKRIPQWWERKGYRFESASQIINGYLDFFEPDFLVHVGRNSEAYCAACEQLNSERIMPRLCLHGDPT